MKNPDYDPIALLEQHRKECKEPTCVNHLMLNIAVIHRPIKNVIDRTDKKLFCEKCLDDYPCATAQVVQNHAHSLIAEWLN